MNLLLEPHPDDAALFAAYTCLRNHPLVVTCLKADVQYQRGHAITPEMREDENRCALNLLGCERRQLEISEAGPSMTQLEVELFAIEKELEPEVVWAPAVEEDGHLQHTMVARAAQMVFGARVRPYMTYRRGHGRSKGQTVIIPTPGERSLKRQALQCYESQIALENTAFWFSEGSDWGKEWLA